MGRTLDHPDFASASPVIHAEEADPRGEQRSPREAAVQPGMGMPWEKRMDLPERWRAAAGHLDRFLAYFWNDRRWFAVFILMAVASALWGYISFYGPQYAWVPWYTWIFVADSPFALTLWIVAAFAVRGAWDRQPGLRGAGVALLVAWAAALNIKIGVWTPFILLYYPDAFFVGSVGRQLFQVALLGAHLGMVVYALFLLRKTRALPAWAYVLVLGLLFLWDFMDYFFTGAVLGDPAIKIYPLGIPADGRLPVTVLVTISLSVVSALAVWIAVRVRGPPSPR